MPGLVFTRMLSVTILSFMRKILLMGIQRFAAFFFVIVIVFMPRFAACCFSCLVNFPGVFIPAISFLKHVVLIIGYQGPPLA